MAKNKTKRRTQKGGFSFNPFDWFNTNTNTNPVPTSSFVDDAKAKGEKVVTTVTQGLNNIVSSISPSSNPVNDSYQQHSQYGTENQNLNQNQYTMGGKRKQRHSKMMKGGSKSRKTRRRRRKH